MTAVGLTPWPYPNRPCWVFSQRRLEVAPPDVVVTDRSPRQVVTELEARGCQRAWLVGVVSSLAPSALRVCLQSTSLRSSECC